MAELTINTADIAAALEKNLADFKPDMSISQVGRILEVGDGIARVSGLPDAGVNETARVRRRHTRSALNLDEESNRRGGPRRGASIEEGQTVKATGRILSVPVGDGLLGRVIDTRRADRRSRSAQQRREPAHARSRRPASPAVSRCTSRCRPASRADRLDRPSAAGSSSSSSATARRARRSVDTILNQKGQGVKCIYVAIGQKGSTVANTVSILTHRAPAR